jgi:hypothetical protein
MNSFLLPGRDFGPAPVAPPPSVRPFRWMRVLIVLWLLVGLVFLIWKLQPESAVPQAALITPKPGSQSAGQQPLVTAISTEDLLRHMDEVNVNLQRASERIRRAQEQINRTLPSIERNYLLVEKQHLDTALAISEAARHELEESRQEFELVLNSLRKEHQLQ